MKKLMNRWGWAVVCALALAFAALPADGAQSNKTANAQKARRIFDKTYDMVFGEGGCSLRYDVNIIHIYKTSGRIWYKDYGKKSRFTEERYASWCDGKDFYRVDRKKKTVEIHNPYSEKRDKYASKFTFDVNKFYYSVTEDKTNYTVSLDAMEGADGIKHAKIVINKKTFAPVRLKIKVAFFWTTVKISDFKTDDISDASFVFPRNRFKDYQLTDCRGDE